MVRKKLITIGLAMVLAMSSSVVAFSAPMETAAPVEQGVRLEAKLSAEDVQILSQLFDAGFFAKRYPSIAKALNNDTEAMFKYFCKWGLYEGKRCCAEFDVVAYSMAYPDLAKAFGTDVMAYYKHYVSKGKAEGRIYTTVEECRKNGISTKMMESQRFALDENGRPAFVKFFDAEAKAFVYNEAEAKTAPAGTYSDYDTAKATTTPEAEPVNNASSESPSYTKKKEEPSKPGFNSAAYQRDISIWQSKKPDIKDYLEDGVYEEYEEAFNAWMNAEPTLERIKNGRWFTSEAAALEAFNEEHNEWEASEPEIEEYISDAKLAEFTQDTQTWNEEEPNYLDYYYGFNRYESEQAALAAYGVAYDEWNDRLVDWLEANDKNDYSVGYATQDEAASAYDSALFDFAAQFYNIDYNTQFKSKTKDEVANQRMVEAYSNYMAEWSPWYMEKSNALSVWKMQNPTATVEDEQAWAQAYLAEHPEPVQPTLETIKAGLVKDTDYLYENEVDAASAYRSEVNSKKVDAKQQDGAPQSYDFRVGKYATEDEANAARVIDIEEYKGIEAAPSSADYYFDPNPRFASQDEAYEAYDTDVYNWQHSEPQFEDYADMASYQAAHEEWVAMEPKLDDGYYEVDANAINGDGDYIAVSYVENEDGPFYDTDFYIDDRHYPNAPTKEELLTEIQAEWNDEMPVLEDEDWKAEGEEQYNENTEDWLSHEPERPQYEEGSDGNWEGCPDYEYVEPNQPTPPEPIAI